MSSVSDVAVAEEAGAGWPTRLALPFFLITLVAHVFSGLAMGLLVEQFLTEKDRAWLLPFLMSRQQK